jgi:hypothetical protein
MVNVMRVYAQVAAAHGDVDAGDALAVQHFFENVVLTK